MQDNLEFLQWTKRFWDQYYPGGDYDAIGRRKASGAPPASGPPAVASSRTSGTGAARRGTTPTNAPAARTTSRTVGGSGGGAASSALIQENTQLKETVTGLERERDFYFSKLRDIELLLQQAVEADPKLDEDDEGIVKHIQTILYSTEVSWSCYYKTVSVINHVCRRGSRFRQKARVRSHLRMTWRLFERVILACCCFDVSGCSHSLVQDVLHRESQADCRRYQHSDA